MNKCKSCNKDCKEGMNYCDYCLGFENGEIIMIEKLNKIIDSYYGYDEQSDDILDDIKREVNK